MKVPTITGRELAAPLRGFFDYWDSLPKENHIPKLADFFDHVPPAIAPYLAIADVRGPEDAHLRLFGTRLVERAEFDPTGLPVAAVYAEHLRKRIHAVLWATVRRPAGYLLRRQIVVRSGFMNEHPGLGLPVDVPTSGLRAVIAYSPAIADSTMIDRGRDTLVQEMTLERWVDVGAGTPG